MIERRKISPPEFLTDEQREILKKELRELLARLYQTVREGQLGQDHRVAYDWLINLGKVETLVKQLGEHLAIIADFAASRQIAELQIIAGVTEDSAFADFYHTSPIPRMVMQPEIDRAYREAKRRAAKKSHYQTRKKVT
ncbi:MAG: hypothetical protein HYV42_00215 [Candidatus Magasanikbacteria bacterium]|nr:hypothetical protein [Candidatus Magasanikbacteria bacterium]